MTPALYALIGFAFFLTQMTCLAVMAGQIVS